METPTHPTGDKFFGAPSGPATSIICGKKGPAKPPPGLRPARHTEHYNDRHPGRRLFVVQYDDFNPFLDRFRDRLSQRNRRAERVLSLFKLWDHMDAILSMAVTGLVDHILGVRQPSTAVVCDLDPALIDKLD